LGGLHLGWGTEDLWEDEMMGGGELDDEGAPEELVLAGE